MEPRIERINELSRLARERALSAEEQAERTVLRAAYVADMKRSLKTTLDNTYVVDEKGNEKPLRGK